MRSAACAVFIAVFLTACGYVGPVLPPSPNIPSTITDLSAVERGDKILVFFTAPARTTDGLPITSFSEIKLQVGAKSYFLYLPAAGDKSDPQPKPISYTIPVSEWTGQHIEVQARTSVKKIGHTSPWSNKAVLDIIPPLARPVVGAEGSAGGIVLNWARSDGAQYSIQRQGPSDKQPIQLATVNDNSYVDISAQYDTDYQYVVTAKNGTAESLPSESLTISAPDKYPPAVPTGLTVAAGPDSVDLAWQRNAEPDFQGYYIYRSSNSGPFERIGELNTLPTYSDHNVEHDKTYKYEISAIDKKANESPRSNPVEVQY